MSIVTENPRGSCVLGGINSTLSAVNKFCPIFHSGPGCGLQTSAGEAGQAGLKSPHFLSSVSLPCSLMLEREVVFGGIEKLTDTIRGSIDIIDADAYFILNGCTSGIIGDDTETVAKGFRAEGFPVYNIPTPGFAGDSNLGYETTISTFLSQLVEPGRPRQANLINLLGIFPYHDPYWAGTFEELVRIFSKLGLEVNTFFSHGQGIEHIKNAGAAALNVIVNPWLLQGEARKFEKRFGVPSLRFPGLPVGATDTTRLVRQVADALAIDGKLVEDVIYEEESYVYNYYETAIGALSWKKFAVIGDANVAIGMTHALANDLGFTPVVTVVTEPVSREADKAAIRDRIQDLEYVKGPDVVFATDNYDVGRALDEYNDVSLFVGSSLEREIAFNRDAQIFVAAYPITDQLILNRTYSGYRGAITLVEDLFNNL
ncbi:MAG: nitrogen fixation protein NifK [Clostridiales Family XIII bacterium]|jgi:nitrogenase molybdenum-iron protein beta chain|nr:nitrogen fixation protein NifK [Clostridiales Family XIII bacterium]